ncbi:MAG: DNA polymerase III subunit delta [Actinomycetota bacterium]|nr:DNA polymerase III subunit delta [Actinomycetota bacterium]
MAPDALKPVYLFAGSDRPKIRRALARLRSRFGQAFDLLSADEASGTDAVAALNALGLFASEGGRLVVVEGVDRWRREDVDAVADYLSDPVPGAVLALVLEGRPRSDALREACGHAGEVLTYDIPRPRDVSVWVRAEFERLETRVDAEASRALVEIVGEDVTALASEIEKIATWAAGERVERGAVELLATPTGETFPWALTDAWGERDATAALAACEALLEQRAREPFSIAAALASYVGRVRAVQALAGTGAGAREVARRLRMKDYPARKALAYAGNYSREELEDAIVRLAELDTALKGASRLGAELELERALADVTSRERAAGRAGG